MRKVGDVAAEVSSRSAVVPLPKERLAGVVVVFSVSLGFGCCFVPDSLDRFSKFLENSYAVGERIADVAMVASFLVVGTPLLAKL